MTIVAKITAIVAAGNFESVEDAAAWAEALRAVAAERHPDAEINVTIAANQTGGGFIRVNDGLSDADESEADILSHLADRRV